MQTNGNEWIPGLQKDDFYLETVAVQHSEKFMLDYELFPCVPVRKDMHSVHVSAATLG